MTVSSARRTFAAALVLAGLAGPALAQQSGPIRLIPLAPPGQEAAPAEPRRPAPMGIETRRLGSVTADSVGGIDDSSGGLGGDMWTGTSRPIAEALIAALPVKASSPAMRDLMRRLLLTAARAPGDGDGSVDWVALRVEQLAALGELDGLGDLLRAVPDRARNARLLRVEADLMFLGDKTPSACALAAGQVGAGGGDGAYWQKALIFCQMLAGETDKASLGYSLLRETGGGDEGFNALYELLAGRQAKGRKALQRLPDPSPLHLAMVRAAKVPLPAETLAGNDPALLRTIARSADLPDDARLAAAERAEARGALDVSELRDLYAGLTFAPGDLASPLSAAERGKGPRVRALLYRTATTERIAAVQAEVTARALDLARGEGAYDQAVRVFLPVIAGIRPTLDLAWFAPQAVRALLAGGKTDEVRGWFVLLRSEAQTRADAADELARLMPLAKLAGGPVAVQWRAGDLDRWYAVAVDKSRAESGAPLAGLDRAAVLYALLDAAGERIADGRWNELIVRQSAGQAVLPSPAAWLRLLEAGEVGRRAETVAAAMVALGSAGPGGAHPAVLHAVVKGLRGVGLEREAAAVALEAAAAAGL